MSSSTTTITTVSIPDGKDEDFLTLAEVAAILRVPVNTLRWWRQCGDGPALLQDRPPPPHHRGPPTWINEQKNQTDPTSADELAAG